MPISGSVNTVLDIGTGTGLLSLMLAQRSPRSRTDAIEINEEAARQAAENCSASPFAARIRVIIGDARALEAKTRCYDLIICNPPFFSKDLTGPDMQRNAVRHDAQLTTSDIAGLAIHLLKPEGTLCVMWPERRADEWSRLMTSAGFTMYNTLKVCNKAGGRYSSIISVWGKDANATGTTEELIIRDNAGNYTPEFVYLLKDFYLRLL